MKITGVDVVPFETFVDRIAFGQLLTDYRVVQTVTTVRTDDGAEGYYCDPLGPDGYVDVPSAPGLGYRIVWDYIDAHRLDESQAEPVAPPHPR